MSDSVSYQRHDDIAVVTIDDGKANALSAAVLAAVQSGLDQAEGDGSRAAVLIGRPGVFSGGFDLGVMRSGDVRAIGGLVTDGGELVSRIYRSEMPVVGACSGHAVAAGALVMLACHHRVGAQGETRISLPETAISMILPDWGVVIAEERITRRHLPQAVIESRVYDPAGAVEAGFLDQVVAPEDLLASALAEARRLGALDRTAYAGNAAKLRGAGIERLAAAVARDRAAVAALA